MSHNLWPIKLHIIHWMDPHYVRPQNVQQFMGNFSPHVPFMLWAWSENVLTRKFARMSKNGLNTVNETHFKCLNWSLRLFCWHQIVNTIYIISMISSLFTHNSPLFFKIGKNPYFFYQKTIPHFSEWCSLCVTILFWRV